MLTPKERKERLSKNPAGQKLGRISAKARRKRAGSEKEYKKQMGDMARVRWNRVKGVDKSMEKVGKMA